MTSWPRSTMTVQSSASSLPTFPATTRGSCFRFRRQPRFLTGDSGFDTSPGCRKRNGIHGFFAVGIVDGERRGRPFDRVAVERAEPMDLLRRPIAREGDVGSVLGAFEVGYRAETLGQPFVEIK